MSRLDERIRRFKRLHHLARAGERRAGQALGAANNALLSERERLTELTRFSSAPAPASQEPSHADNRQRFASRLRVAIDQQATSVTAARQSVDRARDAWFSARQNSQRFEAVLKNLAGDKDNEEARRLMTMLDEHAARQFFRRRERR